MIKAADVTSANVLLDYAQQQLGWQKPVKYGERSGLFKRLNDQMEFQNWTYLHLVAAIEYCKSRRIRLQSFDYLYYNVGPAVEAGFLHALTDTSEDDRLQRLVTEAIYKESDPTWVSRLAAAQGSRLREVYNAWVQHYAV